MGQTTLPGTEAPETEAPETVAQESYEDGLPEAVTQFHYANLEEFNRLCAYLGGFSVASTLLERSGTYLSKKARLEGSAIYKENMCALRYLAMQKHIDTMAGRTPEMEEELTLFRQFQAFQSQRGE